VLKRPASLTVKSKWREVKDRCKGRIDSPAMWPSQKPKYYTVFYVAEPYLPTDHIDWCA